MTFPTINRIPLYKYSPSLTKYIFGDSTTVLTDVNFESVYGLGAAINKPELFKAVKKLLAERPYLQLITYVPLDLTLSDPDLNTLAREQFRSFSEDTQDKFVPLIKAITNNMTDLIALKNKRANVIQNDLEEDISEDPTTNTKVVDGVVVNDDDAAVDSTLHKFNDTLRAGLNPDLTTDTYLSKSDRNTMNIGARKNTVNEDATHTDTLGAKHSLRTNTGTIAQDTTDTSDIELRIKALSDNLEDVYAKWVHHLSSVLTFN